MICLKNRFPSLSLALFNFDGNDNMFKSIIRRKKELIINKRRLTADLDDPFKG
jgi:hypothetical protein